MKRKLFLKCLHNIGNIVENFFLLGLFLKVKFEVGGKFLMKLMTFHENLELFSPGQNLSENILERKLD